jgi:hypothetical protein
VQLLFIGVAEGAAHCGKRNVFANERQRFSGHWSFVIGRLSMVVGATAANDQ